MKKIIIVLIVVLSLAIAGVLYGTHDKTEEVKTVEAEKVETEQYPEQMPDVILDPMTGYVLY